MEDAAETDQVVVLHKGDLVFSGTPYQTFTHFSKAEFQELGLGIPHALAWAKRLSSATGITLGKPLTLSELIDALVNVLSTNLSDAQTRSGSQPSSNAQASSNARANDLTQGGQNHGA